VQNPNQSRDPKSLGPEHLPAGPRAEQALRNSETDGGSVLLQTSISPRHKLEAWLAEMVRMNASDLILRAGGRPSCRIDGRIHFLPGRVPPPGALLEVLTGVCGEKKMAIWEARGSVDTALQLDGLGRFRLNAYKQMGEPAVVLRKISQEAPVLSSLGLPTQQLERIAMKKRGIVLVTGIAGSGKSTALAGLIQHMNTHAERHIITLEDPVELLFTEDRCVISQREVGTDTIDFAEGLRHALRQSPDVILIGEMRDAETVGAALDATETGHLVFSTLHTVNAPQTVDRILSFFPQPRHQQIRQRLAENIVAVMSMRLLPRKSGRGMVPACELLLSTPRVRDLLYEGQVSELSRVVEAGHEEGLISFNHSLRLLVQQDVIELETALAASDRPEELLLALRGFSKGKGNPQNNPQGGRLRLAGGE
jgi:pilus retraction protein PilT